MKQSLLHFWGLRATVCKCLLMLVQPVTNVFTALPLLSVVDSQVYDSSWKVSEMVEILRGSTGARSLLEMRMPSSCRVPARTASITVRMLTTYALSSHAYA